MDLNSVMIYACRINYIPTIQKVSCSIHYEWISFLNKEVGKLRSSKKMNVKGGKHQRRGIYH